MNPYKYLECYQHDHRVGVLVEIQLSSEISSRVPEIRALAKDLAPHIAACDPKDDVELLSQGFVKEPSLKISEYIDGISKSVGEPIRVTRFIRWDVAAIVPVNDDPPPRDPANVIRLKSASR